MHRFLVWLILCKSFPYQEVFMKLYSLKKFFVVVSGLFMLSACGNSNPYMNNAYYNQQGFCPAGMTNQNGMCVGTANGQQPVSYCQAGTAYPSYGGYCNQGFAPMNGMCVCQATNNNTQTQTQTSGQNQCKSGYHFAAGGCYQQGICQSGYVYATPYGMCYPIGY